jgi:hypothetical protein
VRPGRDADHSHISSAEVKEDYYLYLDATKGPSIPYNETNLPLFYLHYIKNCSVKRKFYKKQVLCSLLHYCREDG